MSQPTIALSDFARRQTRDSQFSHWEMSEEELLRRVRAGYPAASPGFKGGVLEVRVDPEGFFTNVVRLKEGDRFGGIYAPRKANETPRKQTYVLNGQKMPAAAVQVILYHADVLAENNEGTTDADWEIVSVNATPDVEPSPMSVGTLLANHFHKKDSNDGGTSTDMSDEKLVAALGVSYEYWRDKGNAGPSPVRDRHTPQDPMELGGGPILSDGMMDGACSVVGSIIETIQKDGYVKLKYGDIDDLGGNIHAKAFGMLNYVYAMRVRILELEEALGISVKREGDDA